MPSDWEDVKPGDWEDVEPQGQKTGGFRRFVADPAISALKGAIALPEAVVGLADIPTGGFVGRLANKAGYRPAEARKILDEYYSPEQKAAFQKVSEAKGFIPTVTEALKNPSTIAHSVIESAPSMLGGAGIARGVLKAAPKVAPIVAGAMGEGAISAGAAAEQIREETGYLTPQQSAIAAGSGVLTGGFGVIGGKLAQKLGIADIDTLLAGGRAGATGGSLVQDAVGKPGKFFRSVAKGALAEGALEEMPQSAQEQAAQNLATGQPWSEGVGAAAATGLLAGGVMGGGAQGINSFQQWVTRKALEDPRVAQSARLDAVNTVYSALPEGSRDIWKSRAVDAVANGERIPLTDEWLQPAKPLEESITETLKEFAANPDKDINEILENITTPETTGDFQMVNPETGEIETVPAGQMDFAREQGYFLPEEGVTDAETTVEPPRSIEVGGVGETTPGLAETATRPKEMPLVQDVDGSTSGELPAVRASNVIEDGKYNYVEGTGNQQAVRRDGDTLTWLGKDSRGRPNVIATAEILPDGTFDITEAETPEARMKALQVVAKTTGLSFKGSESRFSRTENNASGESAASLEALSRAKTENPRYVVDVRTGKGRPISGVDAVDYAPAAHEMVMQRDPQGRMTVVAEGKSVTPGSKSRVTTRFSRVIDLAQRGLPKSIIGAMKNVINAKGDNRLVAMAETITDDELTAIPAATWAEIDRRYGLNADVEKELARMQEVNARPIRDRMSPERKQQIVDRNVNAIKKARIALYVRDLLRDDTRFSRLSDADIKELKVLKPALVVGGRTLTGLPGEAHVDLAERHGVKTEYAKGQAEQGFMTPEGGFQTLNRVGAWLKTNDPETLKYLKNPKVVDSVDYAYAKGLRFNKEGGTGVAKADIEKSLKAITPKLKIPVVVVDSASQIPGLEDPGFAFNGVFHDGKIYLVAENLNSVEEAHEVLFKHEIRHAGLRVLMGRAFDNFLGVAWSDQGAKIREFANSKGIDYKTKEGKLEATEEYIVELAKGEGKSPLLDKFIARLKAWLRSVGLSLKISDTELRALVARAGEVMFTENEQERMVNGDEEAKKRIVKDFKGTFGEEVRPEDITFVRTPPELLALANLFRKTIRLYKTAPGLKLPAGFITSDNENIYLAENASLPHLALLGHELTHTLERDDPATYKEFKNYIASISREGVYAQYSALIKSGRYDKNNESQIFDEYLGNIVGSNFMKPSFWEKMAQKEPSLFARIIQRIKDFFSQTSRDLEAMQVSEVVLKDVNRAEEVVAKVFAKYARKAAEGDPRFAAAWHGTPHDVDKFSTEKIGTGEGAQAYGYGLYFAENKEVAEYYRKAVAASRTKLTDHAEILRAHDPEVYALIEKALTKDSFHGTGPLAVGHIVSDLASSQPSMKVANLLGDDFKRINDAITLLPSNGRLYKVELAPKEDEYLLWDKPLSEQSEKVKEALDSIGMGDAAKELRDIAARLKTQYQEEMSTMEAAASKLPRGIERNTFINNWFDGRGQGLKTQLLNADKALEPYGLKKSSTGKTIYEQMTHEYGSDRAASDYLHSLGIRGIKYLDGSSRHRPMREIKQAFLDELPEDATFEDVTDLIGTGKFSAEQETFLKALDADDWLGFDYPAQAISAALGKNLDNYDASDALRTAVAELGKDQTFNYVIFNEEDVQITARFNRSAGIPAKAREFVDNLGKASSTPSDLKRWLENVGTAFVNFVYPVDRMIRLAVSSPWSKPLRRSLIDLEDLKTQKSRYPQAQMNDGSVHADAFLASAKTDEELRNIENAVWKATLYQLDPLAPLASQWLDESWTPTGNSEFASAKDLVEAKKDLSAAWAKLTQPQKDTVKTLVDHMKALRTAHKEALLDGLKYAYGEDTEGYEKEAERIEAQFAKVLRGLYMPLMRDGKFMVRVWEEGKGEELEARMFDSEKKALVFIEDQRAKGLHTEFDREAEILGRNYTNVPAGFVSSIEEKAKERGLEGEAYENFVQDLKRLWVDTLSPNSGEGNKLQRKGIAGFDTDIIKAYGSYIRKEAQSVAKARYGWRIADKYREMHNIIRELQAPGKNPEVHDINMMLALVQSLEYTDQHRMQEVIHPAVQTLQKITFMQMLSSPSVWAVQWSQPLIFTIPKLAARFGFSRASGAYFKAAKEYMASKYSDEKVDQWNQENNKVGEKVVALIERFRAVDTEMRHQMEAAERTSTKNFDGEKVRGASAAELKSLEVKNRNELTALKARLTKETSEEKAAINVLLKQLYEPLDATGKKMLVLRVAALHGGTELSRSHDLHDQIVGADGADTLLNKLVEKSGFFMRKSETGSRKAAAISSFDLAYDGDFIGAMDYTIKTVIRDTLYDFSPENRPKIARGNAGRLLLQFQFFRMHTIGKVFQMMKDAIGKEYDRAIVDANGDEKLIQEAKDAKRQARREFAFSTGIAFMLAGAAGTPITMLFSNSFTSLLMSAISWMFEDPDDPWDLERDFSAALHASIGDGAATVIEKGLPAAFGMDISRRIGMGGMADMIQGDPPPGMTASQRTSWYANRLLGPSWSIVGDMAKAQDALANGEYGKAMQYSSPKVIKDLFKAYDVTENGVTTASGKRLLQPEDVNMYSVALMLTGINPIDVSLAREEARELSNLSTTLTQRRSRLLKDYANAVAENDYEAKEEAVEKISSWGTSQPRLKISYKELATATKRALQNRAGGKKSKKELIIEEQYGLQRSDK